MENNKLTREDAELGIKKLLEGLKQEQPQKPWTKIFRSEEDWEYLEKKLIGSIDEDILKK